MQIFRETSGTWVNPPVSFAAKQHEFDLSSIPLDNRLNVGQRVRVNCPHQQGLQAFNLNNRQ